MNNDRLDSDVQRRMNYTPSIVSNPDTNPAAATVMATAGGIAGGFATSGIALAVTETTGLAGYSAGLAAIITKVGCGSISALTSFSLIAAGPIVGGLLGLAIYKGIKNSKI